MSESGSNESVDSMLANAVRFLQDPQVQQSPLSKRIAFLESKGLTKVQIDQAMASAGVSTSTTAPMMTPPPIPSLPTGIMQLQKETSFDWHRLMLFVAVLTSAGVALSQTIVSVLPIRVYNQSLQLEMVHSWFYAFERALIK